MRGVYVHHDLYGYDLVVVEVFDLCCVADCESVVVALWAWPQVDPPSVV